MQEQTNIIFAIDATSSMKDYYKPIAASLSEIMDNNDTLNQHKIKFGYITYRDYEDGKGPCKTCSWNFHPLTATTGISELKEKIIKIPTSSNLRDQTKEEAQYNGLINGIKALNLNKDQSNVVVLIGDCGNHKIDKKSLTAKDVIDLFIQKNINLINLQVISKQDNFTTYLKFNKDARSYITSTAEAKLSGKKTSVKYDLLPPTDGDNTYKLEWTDQTDCSFQNMFGRFIYAETGIPMLQDDLKTSIISALGEYMTSIDNNINILEGILNNNNGCGLGGGEAKVDSIPGGVMLWCENNMTNEDGTAMSKEQCEEFFKRTEVTTKAYVAVNYLKKGKVDPDNDQNALRYVVFLSNKELTDLKGYLNILSTAECAGTDAKKQCFQKQMINTVKGILGPNTTTDAIKELTMNQIWDVIFGVDCKNRDLKDKQLNEITDLKPKKFNRFIDEYEAKCEIFINETYVNPNPYISRELILNGDKFYWVPIEDLPGTTKNK